MSETKNTMDPATKQDYLKLWIDSHRRAIVSVGCTALGCLFSYHTITVMLFMAVFVFFSALVEKERYIAMSAVHSLLFSPLLAYVWTIPFVVMICMFAIMTRWFVGVEENKCTVADSNPLISVMLWCSRDELHVKSVKILAESLNPSLGEKND